MTAPLAAGGSRQTLRSRHPACLTAQENRNRTKVHVSHRDAQAPESLARWVCPQAAEKPSKAKGFGPAKPVVTGTKAPKDGTSANSGVEAPGGGYWTDVKVNLEELKARLAPVPGPRLQPSRCGHPSPSAAAVSG